MANLDEISRKRKKAHQKLVSLKSKVYESFLRMEQATYAEGYLVIHCLMVNGKHKGKGLGSLLLDSGLGDAQKNQCRGVAVVTSSDSFMAGRDLFIKAGFVPVDRIPPDELLVKKLKRTAPDPRFIVERERLIKRYRKGLTILAADQCPMVPKCVEDIAEASRTLGLEPKVVRAGSAVRRVDQSNVMGALPLIGHFSRSTLWFAGVGISVFGVAGRRVDPGRFGHSGVIGKT